MQKSKVAQCKWWNSWKSKCTSLLLLWHVNDRGRQELLNLTEEIKADKELFPFCCVPGAGDRHRGLRRGFPCYGWLCGCHESFVWVWRARLCHICCRTLWINVVSFTCTPSFLIPAVFLPSPLPAPTNLPSCPAGVKLYFLVFYTLLSSRLWWTSLELTSLQAWNLKDFPFQNWTFIHRV